MRRVALIAAVAIFAVFAAGGADSQSGNFAQQPAAAPPPDTATDLVVLSRTDNTQAVEAVDQGYLLAKTKREEHAVVRRLIFIVASLRLTEPAASVGDAPQPQTCRWTYRSFMQRQVCFTSMTGLFSCTEPEITPLADEAHGDAPAPDKAPVGFCNDVFRPAVNARVRLAATLRDRAAEMFEADQKAKVDPLLRAAGAVVTAEARTIPRVSSPRSSAPAGH